MASDKPYKKKMKTAIEKNITRLKESISENNLIELIDHSREWINKMALEHIQCSIRNSGRMHAAGEYFKEFTTRTEKLPLLCEFLWEFNPDSAELIDIEERYRRSTAENFVSSTSCEATDLKSANSECQLLGACGEVSQTDASSEKASAYRAIINEMATCVEEEENGLRNVKDNVLLYYKGKCDIKAIEKAENWMALHRILGYICACDMNDIDGLIRLVKEVSVFGSKRSDLIERLKKLKSKR